MQDYRQVASSMFDLTEAAVSVLADVREGDETPEQTIDRLDRTFGTINSLVGIRARTLVTLLRALQNNRTALGMGIDGVAEQMAARAQRRVTYGPRRHDLAAS
jgi:hypothetical protein